MKFTAVIVWLSMVLAASSVHAADATTLEKTKTGILPSGGFYKIYEGTCRDQSAVSVASMERLRRWCFNAAGELACVRQRQQALELACARPDVAALEFVRRAQDQ